MINKKKKLIYIIFSVIIFISIGIFFSKVFIINYLINNKLGSINLPSKKDRLLIFAPHNNDETLGCGELIKKSVKNGADVRIVFITNGDGFNETIEFDYLNFNPKAKDYLNFGYTKQKESIAALKLLGLKEDKITFLGYPEGGISYLWNIYWDKNNPYSNENMQSNLSLYTNSYTKKVTYSGENLIEDIKKIVNEYKPTEIIYPHPHDRHPDHWATNSFVKYTITAINYIPKKELLYLIHRDDWEPDIKNENQLHLVPPKKLLDTGTKWFTLNLNDEDIKEKKKAISIYKSQFRIINYMMPWFERKNELFGYYDNCNLVSSSKDKNSTIPIYSNKIIIDSNQDAVKLNINKSEDILALYMEKDKDKNLNVFIQIDDNINKEVKYSLNCILFYKENIKRLTLEIKNEEIIARSISNQSIINIEGLEFNENGKMLHIIMPYNIVGNFEHVFVNANTRIEDKIMDKTVWRMVNQI